MLEEPEAPQGLAVLLREARRPQVLRGFGRESGGNLGISEGIWKFLRGFGGNFEVWGDLLDKFGNF